MAPTMANLSSWVREHPPSSHRPDAEKTEGRAGQVGTIQSRDGRSLEVRRYCQPRLRPWALIATGPLRGPRFTPCRRPFSLVLPFSQASGRLLPPGPPENLACGPCSTAHYGVPLRAPGRTETPDQAIQNNTINKIRGKRQPPDRLRMPPPVPVPLPESTISPSATGTCRTSGGYS
jgi:hypothetical protein